MSGWLARWERQNWRTASGKRVGHTDLWRQILRWFRRFEQAPGRVLTILHVRGHVGNKGNERADELAKLGAKLRHDIMVGETSDNWVVRAKELYWRNRNEDT